MTAPLPVVVIVGAGHAGAEAATAIRQGGHAGPIVLVGAEARLPYHRPPLSKSYLAGSTTAEALQLKAGAMYEKAGVELRLGTPVQAIDRAAKALQLADGSVIPYTTLVLAPGSRPRRFTAPGLDPQVDPANLYYLRTVDDIDRLRPRFVAGARLLLVGGGYIGLEAAAAARKAGLEVTVLEAESRVLARVAAPAVSTFFEQLHRAAGCTVRTSTRVDSVLLDADGDIALVRTSDGSSIPVEIVIAGIGVIPNTELASAAGLAVDNGILVDASARTADPDIFAIGDCANFPHRLYGRRVRLESVPNALEQARLVAGAIAGKALPEASVPWFWSDQYETRLQMAGLSAGYDSAVVRGPADGATLAVFYLKEGIVIAADCVNRAPEFLQAKRLVAARRPVDAAQLADDSVPLKALVDALLA